MKRQIILLLLFISYSVAAFAQQELEFSVTGFTEKPFDTAANDERYRIVDGNGNLFSIIKLVAATPGDDLRAYSFDFGYCESRIKSVDGEVWVYVQRNAMRAKIRREGYKSVTYELPTTVPSGKVYEMELSAAPKVVKKRYLLFKVLPNDSKAQIFYKAEGDADYQSFSDGLVDDEGMLSGKLVLGRYYYKVVSKIYHSSEGVVELTDEQGAFTETVTLRPNFGTVTLTAVDGCEIFVDGQSKGMSPWTGKLAPGFYDVECRKQNHRNGVESIEVKEGVINKFVLKSPVPVTGTLDIVSNPFEAIVRIDGKEYGKTPTVIENLLVGSHNVEISKTGYKEKLLTVAIKENETTEHSVVLEKSVAPKEPKKTTDISGKNASRRQGNSAYVELAGSVGRIMDIGLNAGAYFSMFNIEAYGYYGLQSGTYHSNTYSPVSYGGRIGYAIPVWKGFAFTPQFGVGAMMAWGREYMRVTISTVSLGVRCECFFTNRLGLSITPEFTWGAESENMDMLIGACPDVKQWCDGFSTRFGLYFNF